MTDTIIGALIGLGGIIVGAIIAGPITYFFSRKLINESHKNALAIIKITEFNKAAASFRASFIKEQRLLTLDSVADKTGLTAVDIIKEAIDRQEIAMIRFEPFVCESDIDAYKKAWKEYAGDSKHFEQYSTVRHIDIPEKKKLALDRINNLLKYAKPKH